MDDLNFSTKHMTMSEREESFANGNVVPIGTVCFHCGNECDDVKMIVVSESNQRNVSMFWNALFFLERDEAEYANAVAKMEYGHFLFSAW